MAGLIQQNMGTTEQLPESAEQVPEGMEAPEQEGQEITSKSVRGQMKLPPGLEQAYDKVIKAGLKMMFDPSMRAETMDYIEESEGDPAKMAEGVSSVVVMLFKESNGTLPPNLIIPAGVELIVHAAEVAKSGGMEVSNEALAEAMGETVQQLLTKFGATPEEMQKLMGGMTSGQQAPQGAQTAPAAPQMAAAPQPMTGA